MGAIKGDFTGFTFNGIHSSKLGLTRVSDNNRYTDNLLPTIQDKTVQVPGGDGAYYFGSLYTQRPINISVAFDDLTEEQFKNLRIIFGDKKIHDLIFDETPYKVYRVKSTGTPNLKFVCFDAPVDELMGDYNNTNIYSKEELYHVGARSNYGRIYKGEGQLTFISYNPFAHSRYKYIENYDAFHIPEWGSLDTASATDVNYNLYDWLDSAGLKRSDSAVTVSPNVVKTLDKLDNTGVMFYNPGDFDNHFILRFLIDEVNGERHFNGGTISISEDEFLVLDPFDLKDEDIGFNINGKLNIIEGIVIDKIEYEKVLYTLGKNPMELGWYERDTETGEYFLTDDTIAQPYVVYYEQIIYYKWSGNIYSKYIAGGDYFKLPRTTDLTWMSFTPLLGSSFNIGDKSAIIYDYLYY